MSSSIVHSEHRRDSAILIHCRRKLDPLEIRDRRMEWTLDFSGWHCGHATYTASQVWEWWQQAIVKKVHWPSARDKLFDTFKIFSFFIESRKNEISYETNNPIVRFCICCFDSQLFLFLFSFLHAADSTGFRKTQVNGGLPHLLINSWKLIVILIIIIIIKKKKSSHFPKI